MKRVVFYSWQRDLPNTTNRGLIETALELAAKAIRNDASIEIDPVIDRDVAGTGGSSDIAKTIFGKIDSADVEAVSKPPKNYQQACEPDKTFEQMRIVFVPGN